MVARKHGASMSVMEAPLRASEAAHRASLETYAKRVDRLVGSGDNPACPQAVEFIAHGDLRSAAEQAAHVAALKARHGRKSNFMKLPG